MQWEALSLSIFFIIISEIRCVRYLCTPTMERGIRPTHRTSSVCTCVCLSVCSSVSCALILLNFNNEKLQRIYDQGPYDNHTGYNHFRPKSSEFEIAKNEIRHNLRSNSRTIFELGGIKSFLYMSQEWKIKFKFRAFIDAANNSNSRWNFKVKKVWNYRHIPRNAQRTAIMEGDTNLKVSRSAQHCSSIK